jgi:ABC-type antimicrobial peptide transport system permease subunit
MVRDSAVPVAIGTGVGIGGATLATSVIKSFLFATEPTDPATLTLVAVTVATSGCAAALLPAWRAASVDPVSSLRAE